MVVDGIALDDQEAQTMVEYAVVLGMITLAVVATISLLSGAVLSLFQLTLDAVKSAV